MSHLNNLKSVMISLAAEHKLPEIYQDDITTDVESLDRFDGLRLVWLLRLATAYWCKRKLALIRFISPIGCGLTTVSRWSHSLWIPARG